MKHIYIPSTQAYYVETSEPSEEFLKKFPRQQGWIEVSPKPEEYYDYVDGEWVENLESKTTILSDRARTQRDFKLSNEVDVIASNPLRWAALTDEKRAEWAQYRIDLLNVPQQSGFPDDIMWPTKPESD
jgi:hypothetical protein